MKKPRVVILHHYSVPYRLPLFEKLSKDWDIRVYFCKSKVKYRLYNDDLKNWSFKGEVLKSISLGQITINYDLFRKLVANTYDICIAQPNYVTFFSTLIMLIHAKVYRKPFVIWSGKIEDTGAFYPLSKKILAKIYPYFCKKLLYPHADAFIAYGKNAKNYLIKNRVPENKIFIGTQVIAEDQIKRINISKEDLGFSKKIILFISYFYKRKGGDILIKAFKKLNRKDAILIMAGAGEEEKKLKSLSEGAENIYFPGYVSGKEKAKYYSISDIFVLPTFWDPWGLVINEAMMQELPIIVTKKAGCSKELIDGNGFVVKAGDEEGLRTAIEKLLDDGELRRKMGIRSKEIIKKYNIDYAVNAFKNAVEYAIGGVNEAMVGIKKYSENGDFSMKICYVAGNLNIHDQRFLNKFIEKGYDAHVICLSQKKLEMEGIHFHYFLSRFSNYMMTRFPRVARIIVYPIEAVRSFYLLKKLFKKIKPVILHGGGIQTDGFASALSGFHPFLLMPWGTDVLIRPKRSRIFKMITKYVIRKADMITCDCETVKNEIIKLSGYPAEKIITVPQGIDLNKFNPNVNKFEIREKLSWKDNKILIMTRNFSDVYGIEYFLECIPDIKKSIPEIKVILCGTGLLENKFKNFVKEKKLLEDVYFAGYVNNDELPKYLVASDIYISSSLSDGTSLSLLEAMACQLPVVVTDVPANKEWIEDGINGFIVNGRDSKDLSEKIIKLLKNEKLMKKFGKDNLRMARERADWDKNFEKIVHIYEKLIEELCIDSKSVMRI